MTHVVSRGGKLALGTLTALLLFVGAQTAAHADMVETGRTGTITKPGGLSSDFSGVTAGVRASVEVAIQKPGH